MSDKRKQPQYGIRQGEKDFDEIKPIIEFCTMNHDTRDFCILKAKEAMKSIQDSNISYYKKIAKKIKLELEVDKNETWNCIVGTDYGAYLAFEKANLLYFRMNEIYFLIFRFGAASK